MSPQITDLFKAATHHNKDAKIGPSFSLSMLISPLYLNQAIRVWLFEPSSIYRQFWELVLLYFLLVSPLPGCVVSEGMHKRKGV